MSKLSVKVNGRRSNQFSIFFSCSIELLTWMTSTPEGTMRFGLGD
jgi:hypothetical protein